MPSAESDADLPLSQPKYADWKRADLKPFARNARTHSDAQIEQIAASIRRWGWTTRVLITPDGSIIAGHGRVRAAELLGIDVIPVAIANGWSEYEIRAYVIADNQLALNAGWDQELLRLELGELKAGGFALDLIGFSEGELSELFALPADGASSSAPSLADRFLIPPFSVLDARQGWWQNRKRQWLALGIESEIGRGTDTHSAHHQGLEQLVVRAAKQRRSVAPGGSKRLSGYSAAGNRRLPARARICSLPARPTAIWSATAMIRAIFQRWNTRPSPGSTRRSSKAAARS